MTFGDTTRRGGAVTRHVTITGTRSADVVSQARIQDLFRHYVRPFADARAHFYLGGAVGIDTAALNWLAEHTQASLTVAVPCTVVDQPPAAQEAIGQWVRHNRLTDVVELGAARLDTAAYHARNRWMVDRSGFVIGFPLGTEDLASGTWYTVNYAADQGKPRLLVPVLDPDE